MPTSSSTSVPVRFLDAPAAVRRLEGAARALCDRDTNIAAVVLFGSLATGGATPSSDADLLVVLRWDDRRVIDRVPDCTRPFEGLGLGVQVFPWTEREVVARLAEDDPFAREVLRTGVTLAGRLRAASPT
jgi:predicted nucleotidyltransferase